ncbi:hypothetical protein JTB14_019231 [Gonioctena quinquepunctata]|nr:hypothetical protein JTB14_019231 [Gonioctena quinquepunctata]
MEALPFDYDSDHNPLVISNNLGSQQPDNPVPKWNVKSADWKLFAIAIETSIATCEITGNIDESLVNFDRVVLPGAESAIEKSSFNPKHNPVLWWNNECKQAIRTKPQKI